MVEMTKEQREAFEKGKLVALDAIWEFINRRGGIGASPSRALARLLDVPYADAVEHHICDIGNFVDEAVKL